jgi:hypothetical protein
MPRFSLRKLLISLTLVTVGLGFLHWMFADESVADRPSGQALLGTWFAGCILTGMGLLMPLNRPIVGAFIGLAFAIIGFVLLAYLIADAV